MWDEEDYAGRWIQGICAIFLAILAVGGGYMVLYSTFLMLKFGGFAVFAGCARLCWRCARYAITGRGNVNRESF
jgi:hypothetical protein